MEGKKIASTIAQLPKKRERKTKDKRLEEKKIEILKDKRCNSIMIKKLSILVLSSWYPTRINPTLGNFNEKFAEAAALYNDVVAVHVCADKDLNESHEVVEFEKDGVKTVIFYFKKKVSENIFDKLCKSIRFLKYYFKAFKYVSKKYGKLDIVHLNILYPVGTIALLYKIFYGIPYVISENWTGYLPSNKVNQGFFIRFISRRIACHASALLPVTEDLKKAMLNEGFKSKYFIVPNVTDTQFFQPDLVRAIPLKKIILHVSSLKDEHKNITGLLNVIKRLSLIRSDFELHIVGDGDAKPHIDTIKILGLDDNTVRFFEVMTPQQIADKMRQSDFFVLFSNYENLPCVIVEAFASGLPVVSSTAGGVAEHLTPDKGILLAPKDEEALFNACNNMLDNLNKYDKEKLHQYALDKFSYESVGRVLTKIYKNCSFL